jgi:hypothetical protein
MKGKTEREKLTDAQKIGLLIDSVERLSVSLERATDALCAQGVAEDDSEIKLADLTCAKARRLVARIRTQ